VRINELLAAPATVDWNGDGSVDDGDEWIELYNPGPAVDLSGWLLGPITGKGYEFPSGTQLASGGFLVLYRSETGLPLANFGGRLRLRRPNGTVVSAVTYGPLGPDRAFSRDARGRWRADWPPSPGAANAPAPLATAEGALAVPTRIWPPAWWPRR